MGTTIVIVIAAVIVISVFAILISLRMSVAKAAKHSRAERRTQQQAESTSLWAGALIVDSYGGPAGETAEKARMTLTLEVTSSDGGPYRTTVVWLVDLSALHLTAAGSHVPVKLDAADPQKVYPAVPWASYIGQ